VWRAARHLGVATSDIADIVQEVFLVVHRRIDSFEGRSALRTWLYGICVRVVSDYRRKAFRSRERLSADVQLSGQVPSPETRLTLLNLLSRLSAPHRELLVLYEVEGLTMREVSEVLDMPLQTAYSRHKVARRTLRGFMQEGDADEG
jgi:RNA polymerase sigma-70 factor (ECF subfamily)